MLLASNNTLHMQRRLPVILLPLLGTNLAISIQNKKKWKSNINDFFLGGKIAVWYDYDMWYLTKYYVFEL